MYRACDIKPASSHTPDCIGISSMLNSCLSTHPFSINFFRDVFSQYVDEFQMNANIDQISNFNPSFEKKS